MRMMFTLITLTLRGIARRLSQIKPPEKCLLMLSSSVGVPSPSLDPEEYSIMAYRKLAVLDRDLGLILNPSSKRPRDMGSFQTMSYL
ncbi:hypothetical protein K439DRAFT_763876 [Ramaria rubella]|nr:hypothetical protein K439DRAFT_763876 [Ramaria rubella]